MKMTTEEEIKAIQEAIDALIGRVGRIEQKPFTNPYEEQQHSLWVKRQEVEIATMEFQLERDKAMFAKDK